MGDQVFGVSFDAPLNSAADYARAVRANAPHGLLTSAGRLEPIGDDIPLEAPMTVLDRRCEPTALGVRDIF